MAEEKKVSKGGKNQVTKGVHVDHEFDTFENVTYSNSTWSVQCNDKGDSHTRTTTMQRRSWVDDKEDLNMIKMSVYGAGSMDDATMKELQFSCDGDTVLVKETFGSLGSRYYYDVGEDRHSAFQNSCGFSVPDKELKKILDANTVYLRVVTSGHYFDIDDQQTMNLIEFMKCYYREVIDEKAYPEVADVKPKKEQSLSTTDMVIGCGVIIGILWVIGLFF